MNSKISADEWKNLDWNLSNKELADELGRNQNHVAAMRRKHAPAESKERKRVDWSTVKWKHWSNQELADKYGYNPNHVSAMRQVYSDPINARKDWESVDWSLTNNEIAEELRTDKTYVSHMRSKLAPETIRPPRSKPTPKPEKRAYKSPERAKEDKLLSILRQEAREFGDDY